MEQTEPAGGLDAVLCEEVRVVDASSVLHEEPAMLAVRLIKGPVVAERRDREAGENLLVDGPLDRAGVFPASLVDHRAARPTGALGAVLFLLLPRDLQTGAECGNTLRTRHQPGWDGRLERE